jgi:hypothetical protein
LEYAEDESDGSYHSASVEGQQEEESGDSRVEAGPSNQVCWGGALSEIHWLTLFNSLVVLSRKLTTLWWFQRRRRQVRRLLPLRVIQDWRTITSLCTWWSTCPRWSLFRVLSISDFWRIKRIVFLQAMP